jgi:PIN domain
MLRSSLGIALIYAIRQHDAKIGLPEVIEREVEKHGLAVGLEAIAAVEKAEQQLERLLFRRVTFGAPGETDIKKGIEERLQQLGPLFERVPLTLHHARMALDRVNSRVAPSGKRQEYKDSLIWEAVVELAARFQVILVTEDSGFFRGEELESSLQEECVQKQLSIRGFRSLEGCLTALAPTLPATYSDEVREKIKAALRKWSEEKITEYGNEAKVVKEVDLKLFATEDPSRFALSFTTGGDVMPGSPESEDYKVKGGVFELQATGLVDIADGSILDLSAPTTEFTWKAFLSKEGSLVQRSETFVSGGRGFVVAGPALEAFRDTNWIRAKEE